MKGVGVHVGELLYERMHYGVIYSCIHKCPEAMFRGDVYDTILYQEAMFWGDDLDDDSVPHAYKVVSRRITYIH
jgi:hypothetical protein